MPHEQRSIDPVVVARIATLQQAIIRDATALRGLVSEHSDFDGIDFEDQAVRVIVDPPRSGDAAAERAVGYAQELAEFMDGGPEARADMIEIMTQMMPLIHLHRLVLELRACREADREAG